MPLFHISKGKLTLVGQANFPGEKQLQALVEANLESVFSCRLVRSEYPTGAQHSGRIDTLALSEDDNPVIIEYKKVESSDLINQSLFYLSWLSDHRGDFEVAVQKALGPKPQVDWSAIRVICLAPNYKRYDLHAVQMMGANIELWTYRLFKNDSLYLEEVFQRSVGATAPGGPAPAVASVPLTPGKKAALTRATGSYTFEQHFSDRPAQLKELALAVNDFIVALDPSVQVAPKKYYIAYKLAQNMACLEVQKKALVLYLKLDPRVHKGPVGISRDVSKIGHFGTGDLEVTLRTPKDVEAVKPFLELAYQGLGA
jgi:predicted transport protein